jgi:RNA polymerase sigma factor (sigma-70 family)
VSVEGINIESNPPRAVEHPKFEDVVNKFYTALYRFALSLSQREAEAWDLIQQTFYLWGTKGHQLRDKSKAKTWLFTTLHREFLGSRRRSNRFHHHEISIVEHELPTIEPKVIKHIDANSIIESIDEIDEIFRAPLVLFYMQDHSYQEIAEILDIPTGTVMSRLSRAKSQLRKILSITVEKKKKKPESKIVSIDPAKEGNS